MRYQDVHSRCVDVYAYAYVYAHAYPNAFNIDTYALIDQLVAILPFSHRYLYPPIFHASPIPTYVAQLSLSRN